MNRSDFGVINQAVPLANTEVAIPLPSYITDFAIQAREDVDLKVAFRSGLSDQVFFTIKADKPLFWIKKNISDVILYVQAPAASTNVEILWRG